MFWRREYTTYASPTHSIRVVNQHLPFQSVADSSFFTLEALASSVALESLRHLNNHSDIVTVSAAKPEVLAFSQSPKVVISRTREDYPGYFGIPQAAHHPNQHSSAMSPEVSTEEGASQASGHGVSVVPALDRPLRSFLSVMSQDHHSSSGMHTVAIALGTNVGDRFGNIEFALRLLENPLYFLSAMKEATLSIIDTSFMYETAPMYVTDQPMFINCACLVRYYTFLILRMTNDVSS